MSAKASAATYDCANGKSFSVVRSRQLATVEIDSETYELSRRSSSMGVRYSSPQASLIIDGDFAVFASEKIIDLRLCGLVDG
jgi:hypothetical protein